MPMSMIVLHTGQVQLETDLLGGGSLENWSLRLFSTSHTPADTDTLSTYTAIEASFTGYAAKTLTRSLTGSTWSTPTISGTTIDTSSSNAKSSYGSSAQSWSATSAQTIYGYFWSGVTSGVGICAEAFASSISLTNPSTLNLTPVLELGATGT
jgi:hypothetical protein